VNERGDRPTLARLQLGASLKALRTAAGLRGVQAAAAIGASHSKISRIESGRLPVRQHDVAELLSVYGITDLGERRNLLGLAEESTRPGWWDSFGDLPDRLLYYLSVEAAATMLVIYDPIAIPAILQIPAYAQAVTTPAGQPEPWRGGLRADVLARRRQLLRQPGAPQVWALIEESALHRAASGNLRLMAEQLRWLIDAAVERDVHLQIVPAHRLAVLAAAGPFEILRFPDEKLPDIVLLEHLTAIHAVDHRKHVDRYLELRDRLAVGAYTREASVKRLDEIAQSMIGQARSPDD
jgi:transcriptional regulator with XRE-family HTH domain